MSDFTEHGSFQLAYPKDRKYSLLRSFGSWNLETALKFRDEVIEALPEEPYTDIRGALNDLRKWDLETPEATALISEVTTAFSEFHPRFYEAYVYSEDHVVFAEHLHEIHNRDSEMTTRVFYDFSEAITWLRDAGIEITLEEVSVFFELII